MRIHSSIGERILQAQCLNLGNLQRFSRREARHNTANLDFQCLIGHVVGTNQYL